MVHKAIESFIDARSFKRAAIQRAFEEMKDETRFVSGEAVDAWVESWDTAHELPPPKADIKRARR